MDSHSDWRTKQDSCMFRRGNNCASPGASFLDVVRAMEQLSGREGLKNLLVVGIAEGQEPLSLLSVLHSIAKRKQTTLERLAALDVVDIRPPIPVDKIDDRTPGFIVREFFPNESFVKDSLEQSPDPVYLRVRKEVKDVLLKALRDPVHAHWNTSIQDFVSQQRDCRYDLISYNNVHGHIFDNQRKEVIVPGLLSLLRTEGILVTDGARGEEFLDPVQTFAGGSLVDQFHLVKVAPGIYRRLAVAAKKE